MDNFAAFQTTEPPAVETVERPKRGPKKGVKRGPRVANGTSPAAIPNNTDHDVLVAVVQFAKLLNNYPPQTRQGIITALNGMFA